MSDRKIVFQCRECGYVSSKWMGRCPECRTWDGMNEETARKPSVRSCLRQPKPVPVPLCEISVEAGARQLSGIEEWDRVLGGGLVPGSIVLLAGDPGIGKSTILLQALACMAHEQTVLYTSGEESARQLKLRADRLGISTPRLLVLTENSLEAILNAMEGTRPGIVAVDSIQTLQTEALDAAPGSVGQIRECASRLMCAAKESGIGIFVVGHVTKEGSIAGPRALEHLVDTVLYLEGDRTHSFRLLRAVKNRYGSTNEVGVFEMKESGMEEVRNPSRFLLAERPVDVSGSVVACAVEGTRPLLVELQALVCATGWMQPRRTGMGVDGNRLSLLLAVLEKKLGLSFAQQDVFVNVAGGVKLMEPAGDLAMAAAVMSSYLDRPLPRDLAAWGEIGLAGEVRGVGHSLLRASEAQKLGFNRCLVPMANAEQLAGETGVECIGVKSLGEVMEHIFG